MVNDHTHHDVTRHAALMVKSRRFWLIWLIPIGALLAATYLGWRSYINTGPLITLSFESAAGIEAGKTQIKHRDIVMGTVESVKPTDDLSHVTVTARMEKISEPYLTIDARFWVVRPSLSSKNLSGLGTLISGSYIQFVPGNPKNDLERSYVGEESPDFIPPEGSGQTYEIHAEHLGSISQGTPVLFHGIEVGEVLGYKLSDTDGTATAQVFLHQPHQDLVHVGTRFWNTSGVTVSLNNGGVRLRLDSVQSMLTGGIAFDVPANVEPGLPAPAGTVFTLYPDETAADDASYTKRVRFLVHFPDSMSGLNAGAPVRMQGMTIGQVIDSHIEYDKETKKLNVPTVIEVEVERMKIPEMDATTNDYKDQTYDMFRNLVHNGMRATLGTSSLLTGQKAVDLNIMPGVPVAAMVEGGDYPEIPAAEGSGIDSLMAKLNGLAGSPEMKDSIRSLDAALKETSKAFSSDEGGGDLPGMIREIRDAARSVRVLTDYLENHPESLISGKKDKEDNAQ